MATQKCPFCREELEIPSGDTTFIQLMVKHAEECPSEESEKYLTDEYRRIAMSDGGRGDGYEVDLEGSGLQPHIFEPEGPTGLNCVNCGGHMDEVTNPCPDAEPF